MSRISKLTLILSLTCLLLTALLGHWFYAQSFGNCVSVTRLLGLFPRKPELVDAVLTEIPPGATVAADRRSATMVMYFSVPCSLKLSLYRFKRLSILRAASL